VSVDFEYLVDISSTKEDEEQEVSVKDFLQKEYNYLAPYIDNLYYIEANIVFLNYVCKVPQVLISDIFSIKQYGVSKRISSALKRLSIQLKSPDKKLKDSYDFLKNIMPSVNAYVLLIWYDIKTVYATTLIVRASNLAVSSNMNKMEEYLRLLAESPNAFEMKKIIYKHLESFEINTDFLDAITEEPSYFLVVKHKINIHLAYIEELKNYNSRGSHNFRREWH
jgi:hypothetical protein